jgi:hypothetical protein
VFNLIAIEDNPQKLRVSKDSMLKLSITPLHDTPCVLEDEAFLVSFKSRKGNIFSKFTLMPASKAELMQLALFLGTCTFFNTTVTHEIVPGQHITSAPKLDGSVEITFSSEADLFELLVDSESVQKLKVNLNLNQLEAYEEFITSSISTNEAIHHFNMSALEAYAQLQLAS